MVDKIHIRPLSPVLAVLLTVASGALLAGVVALSLFAGALACWPPEGTDITLDGLRNWSCDHLMGPLAAVAVIGPIVLLLVGGALSAIRRAARPLLVASGVGLLCAAGPLIAALVLPGWTAS